MNAEHRGVPQEETGPERTMRAIVQREYGPPDGLRLETVPVPSVGDDEVLVRVRAASVHPDVWHVVRGYPTVLRLMGAGLFRPKNPIPGIDVAGVVEAVGAGVMAFEPGAEVFGETVGGFQWKNGGAFAEYVAAPEAALAPKPSTLTFEEAAAVPTSGLIALQAVRDQGRVQPGQRVLINGAGGGVGTFAVQLAKAYGAEVTAVDRTEKLAMLESIGADRVVDYTREDFTRGSDRYDLIVDVPGNHPFSEVRRVLAPEGTYVIVGHDRYGADGHRVLGSLPRTLKLVAMSPFVGQLPAAGFSIPDKREGLATLTEFVEAGALAPVVDRTFPLGEMPEALQYLESGAVQGKVIVTV